MARRSTGRRESTIQDRSFSKDYAGRLLKRVEQRLMRSSKNRTRREFAQGYKLAAARIRGLIK